jgi:hypothetical protein
MSERVRGKRRAADPHASEAPLTGMLAVRARSAHVSHEEVAVTQPKGTKLTDEDIETIRAGERPLKAEGRDLDQVDPDTTDGTDTQDADGTDSQDADGTDTKDADGTDSGDGVDGTDTSDTPGEDAPASIA